jgi:hypothetical protein
MNERIKLLAEQADEYADNKIQMPGEYHPDWHDTRDEKFAELIVRECASICLDMKYTNPQPHHYAVMIKEHFGVEE